MEVLGLVESACRNHIQATEPEVVVEDGYARPSLVRDASEERVRGVTTMRHVIKLPAKASVLLVVARRQHLQLSFGNNMARESSSEHWQSWLTSVKDAAPCVCEITDPCRHPTQTI